MGGVCCVRRCLPLVMLTMLAACGGGGGGEAPAEAPVVPAPLEISGSVLLPELTQVDADNADPEYSGLPNDTRNAAQALSNPALVGGFLSASAGTYLSGFAYPADPVDIYRVNLLAGQRITVSVYLGDDRRTSLTPSLDLRLVDTATETEMATRSAITGQAQVEVTTSGSYYLELENSGVPLIYNLVVGDYQALQELNATTPAIPPAAEFVPGEVMLAYRPEQTYRLAASERELPGVFLERYDAEGKSGRMRLERRSGGNDRRLFSNDAWSREETLESIRQLRARPDVAWAEPNYIRRSQELTDNPFFTAQWHYPLINLPAAWEVAGADGTDAIVAVLDTGVLLNHPDLVGQFVSGYDFVSSVSSSRDGDGIDPDPSDPGDSPIGESSFHGTHVAGTIAAANNSQGGVGVAYGARIMPLRVLGQDGSGTDADLIQAIRFAAGLSNTSGTLPSRRADVINMSLGGPGASISLQQAVDAAVSAGVIVVAAAGNEATDVPSFPAAYENAVSVTAVGPDLRLAPYSNFGSTVDITAPGGNMLADRTGDGRPDGILSTWGDDSGGSIAFTYALMQGTSMATPHVAGVAALMVGLTRSASDPITPGEFKAYLQNGDLTREIGSTGRDDLFGYGLIDAALAVAATGAQPLPVLSASTSSVVFTQSGTENVTLDVPSGVTNLAASVTTLDGANWLTVSDQTDGDDTTWSITVDSSGLEVGLAYGGTVRFDYTASNGATTENRALSLRVTLALPSPGQVRDAGRHYILLLDSETEDVVLQDEANVISAGYAFRFLDDGDEIDDLEPGDYLLVAGSDLDNDGRICDGGEACAVYPVRNLAEVINLTEAITGLSFSTGYQDTFDSGSLSAGSAAATNRARSYRRLP